MKIAIVGSGAMGSLFGAMLSTASDVYLVDPYEEHMRAIRTNGLVVEEMDGTQKKYYLFATTDPREVDREVDLAIIFTKTYRTPEAALTAELLLGKEGLALTLQNGLDNLDAIAKVVGEHRAIAGVVSHGANMVGPGYIKHAGTGPTYIARVDQHSEFLDRLIKTFRKAGIEAQLSENLDALVWGKLVVNVGINALTAILRVPNGVLSSTFQCEKIMEKAVSEAVSVAKALGISLPYSDPIERVKEACEKTSKNRSSMLQDVLRGARTEVGAINGAVAKKGEEVGIFTPYNVFLSEVIEALEATSGDRIN